MAADGAVQLARGGHESHLVDGREACGRRLVPLPALLTLATAAIVAGARSLYASVQWGQLQPAQVRRALGFTRGRLPAIATQHYALKRLDVPAFDAVLQPWPDDAEVFHPLDSLELASSSSKTWREVLLERVSRPV
jgi:hypothetical protein